jgi:triosephosphate isomerase (TIM)
MRKPLIAGNWKMHGDQAMAAALTQAVAKLATARAEVLLIPPFPYLALCRSQLAASSQNAQISPGVQIALGAQNLSEHAGGAHTGEVAGSMLHDVGCKYVLVGHSERRHVYGETVDVVARKFVQAQLAGLQPILCVGETLAERDSGQTMAVVLAQLEAVLQLAGAAAFESAVVAYEPVWAIGTGRTATAEQAQEVHLAIRGYFANADANIASCLRILYGGSVKAANAAELLAQPDIDGALVGGASLLANEFAGIISAVPSV